MYFYYALTFSENLDNGAYNGEKCVHNNPGESMIWTDASRTKTKTKIATISLAIMLVVSTLVNSVSPFVSPVGAVVDPNGEANAVCASGCEYSTISEAVAIEPSGQTIIVKNGSYGESVNITKTLTLVAESNEVRVFGGPSYNDAAFKVSANDVVIDGFTIGHPSTMLATVGVDLGSSSGAIVKNNIIERNQRGVSLSSASNVTLTGNTIRNNNANPENNAGIWGDNVTKILIDNSTFSGSSNTSINLAGSDDITISNSSFTSGANAAVLWNDSNVSLMNNTLSGLSSTGFFITGTNGVNATGNTLSATTTGRSAFGISTASGNLSANLTFTGNKISGYTNGINAPAGSISSQVAGSKNWWGTASGPTDTNASDASSPASNIGGTGSAANGNIAYAGWCINFACTSFSDDPLTAPSNLTPANGTVTKDRNFSMTWSAVPNAAGYEYQTANTLNNDGTLGTVIYSDSSATNPDRYSTTNGVVTRTNNSTPDNTYYWQVRAVATDGTKGPWSVISKVTVDNVGPTSSNDLAGLVRGTLQIKQTITDNVQPASGKLRIWKLDQNGNQDNSKFYASANVVAADANGVVAYELNTMTQLHGDGNYVAKFTSRDTAGNETVQEKRFIVDNTAPTADVKAESLGQNGVYRSLSYKLYDQYKIDKVVINGVVKDLSDNQYSDVNGLKPGVFGAVSGQNTMVVYDVVGNTRSYSFVLDTTAPVAPTQLTPANNAVLATNVFTFDWATVDDAVEYEFQSSQNPSVNNGVLTSGVWNNKRDGGADRSKLTDPQIPSYGAPDGDWYWQVRAYDAAGNISAWSPVWKLTIDTTAPAKVQGVAFNEGSTPVDDGVTETYETTVTWNAASGAATYDYCYWNDIVASPYRENNCYMTQTTATSQSGVFNQGEGSHFVKIRAIDAAGNVGEWSDAAQVFYLATNASVLGENFNTNSDAGYQGINVGFKLGAFKNVSSVKVELFNGNTPMVANTHNQKLLDLINNDDVEQLSTPFITVPGSYEEEYWTLGNYAWTSSSPMPTKAVVTVSGTNAADQTVTRTTELAPLNQGAPSWPTFASVLPQPITTTPPATGGESGNPGTGQVQGDSTTQPTGGSGAGVTQNANTNTFSRLANTSTTQSADGTGDESNIAQDGSVLAESDTDDQISQTSAGATAGSSDEANDSAATSCASFLGLCWYRYIPIAVGVICLLYFMFRPRTRAEV